MFMSTKNKGVPIIAPNKPNNFTLTITIIITPKGCNFNLSPIIFGVIKLLSICCTITEVIITFIAKLKSIVRAINIAGRTPKNAPIK